MQEYTIFDLKIKNALENGYSIGICPLGELGLELKNILNNRYGVKEKFLVDNYINKWNEKCISINDLKKSDGNTVVILATKNRNVSAMLSRELKNLGYLTDYMFAPSVYPAKNGDYLNLLTKLLAPKKVKGKKLIRVGRSNDGGYVMVDDFRNDMLAYSFGIADDVSWDYDIANYGIDIYMYDPTISELPKNSDRFHFYKVGITGEDDTEDYKKLATILKENKHIEKDNLLLKIDVEGYEWSAFMTLESSNLKKFRQITGEFHNICCEGEYDLKSSVLKKISETHQPIWVHGNNFEYAEEFNGKYLPNVLEITFVSRELYVFEDDPSEETRKLTEPNWPILEDFNLDNWGGV